MMYRNITTNEIMNWKIAGDCLEQLGKFLSHIIFKLFMLAICDAGSILL